MSLSVTFMYTCMFVVAHMSRICERECVCQVRGVIADLHACVCAWKK